MTRPVAEAATPAPLRKGSAGAAQSATVQGCAQPSADLATWPAKTGRVAGPGRRGPASGGPRREAALDLASVETTVTRDADWIIECSDAMEPHRRELATRYATEHPGSDWHLTRATGLGLSMYERTLTCGHGVAVMKSPKGEAHEVELGCGQQLCPKCEDKRRRKVARRLRLAARRADARNRIRNRVPTLLTFTVRDTGDPAADRATMMHAWTRWRAWWSSKARRKRQARWRKRVAAAEAEGRRPPAPWPNPKLGYGFDFALVVEVTPGAEGTGHAHLHVVAWLPKWWDWKAGAEQWARHADGNVDISLKTQDGANPAAYLAKYVAKGSRIEDLPGEVAGEWLGKTYGKRRVTCSRGFWLVETQQAWVLLEVHPAPVDRKGLLGWWLEGKPPPWPSPS